MPELEHRDADDGASVDLAATAAESRKAALTAEAGAVDPEAAVRQARAQAPRGRTERPTSTAG
jgi:hypothetical protein